MKKILAFLLAATLLSAMFVVPSAAADNVNYQITVEDIKKAPNVTDGVVKKGEYGTTPIHRYSQSKAQFTHADDHDEYDNWDFEFYMTWDKDNLYMAWVVETEIHHGLEEGTYDPKTSEKVSDEWPAEGYQSMLGNMWWNSCVQFILTPGAPSDGTTTYFDDTNFLEVGLALLGDGTQARTVWYYPQGADENTVSVNEWDASIVRNEGAKTTTYEVAIPWEMTTVNAMGDNAQFGLTYAVAAQENYNVKKGMIEWQDGVLGSKNPDKAAVVTLKSEDIEQVVITPPAVEEKKDGELPEEAADKVQLVIDGVNKSIAGEKAYLYTDPAKVGENNNAWALSLLLAPVEGSEGYYTIVESKAGNGEAFGFDSEIKEGMIAYSVHSAGEDASAGKARREAAGALAVGDTLAIFGVDFEKKDTLYKNSMFYVVESAPAGDESSEAESSEAESSEVSEESSKAESSKVESSSAAASSEAPAEEGGLGAWLWVIIGVAVAAVAAVAVVVLKKKKA